MKIHTHWNSTKRSTLHSMSNRLASSTTMPKGSFRLGTMTASHDLKRAWQEERIQEIKPGTPQMDSFAGFAAMQYKRH